MNKLITERNYLLETRPRVFFFSLLGKKNREINNGKHLNTVIKLGNLSFCFLDKKIVFAFF